MLKRLLIVGVFAVLTVVFDTGRRERHNRGVIVLKWLRRRVRPVGWTLTVTLAAAVSASCLTGAEMTAEQMACCAAMGHDCGSRAQGADCCAAGTLQVAGRTALKAFSLEGPSPIATPVAVLLSLNFSSGPQPHRHAAWVGTRQARSGSASHLSVLRI